VQPVPDSLEGPEPFGEPRAAQRELPERRLLLFGSGEVLPEPAHLGAPLLEPSRTRLLRWFEPCELL